MAKTAEITELKRTERGVLIRISSLEEPLLLSPSTVINSKLEKGVVVTESQIAIIVREARVYACDRVTLRILARRPHSIGELKTKLWFREYEQDIIDEVIKKRKKQGLLDDVKYAYLVGRSLLERKPCGRSYVLSHLMKRKVEKKVADDVVKTLFEGKDTEELAIAALRKKWWRFGQLELETARTKAYNYLARRGFGYQAAKTAFEYLYNEEKKENSH
ncbi:MAG: regulatory protein RecX [bacterium]|nr:regulatory protein RecX [bacterium]